MLDLTCQDCGRQYGNPAITPDSFMHPGKQYLFKSVLLDFGSGEIFVMCPYCGFGRIASSFKEAKNGKK